MISDRPLRLLLFLPLLLCTMHSMQAQVKFEREYRLKPAAVPEPARMAIDTLPLDAKVKWYYEENLLGNSVEAKFKQKKRRFSIEFDTVGVLQDLEKEMKWDELDAPLRQQIEGELREAFSAYKIQKIQLQYVGPGLVLSDFLQESQTATRPNVEIVVKGKKEKEIKLYEVTFSPEGQLCKTEEIVLKNTDNLEY